MPSIKATYTAPSHDPFTAERDVAAAATAAPSTVADTSAYLDHLRAAVTAIQEDVNRELTARMAIDAEASASSGNGDAAGSKKKNKKAAAAADKEEENYGEEVMEDD